MKTEEKMLDVRNLTLSYGDRTVVDHVSFDMEEGEILGLIGESGSGKSSILNSLIGTLGSSGHILDGQICFEKKPLLKDINKRKCYTSLLREIRGREVTLISQYPDLALDPVFTVGNQMTETMRVMKKISRAAAKKEACAILEELGFADPERIWESYPLELSGGMCQRVAIAMALANHVKLILADEPTSALDVTIQAQVVKTLEMVCRTHRVAVLLVSHNIGVVANLADRIGVLYHGELVELGKRDQVIYAPQHAYTKHLIASLPRL